MIWLNAPNSKSNSATLARPVIRFEHRWFVLVWKCWSLPCHPLQTTTLFAYCLCIFKRTRLLLNTQRFDCTVHGKSEPFNAEQTNEFSAILPLGYLLAPVRIHRIWAVIVCVKCILASDWTELEKDYITEGLDRELLSGVSLQDWKCEGCQRKYKIARSLLTSEIHIEHRMETE